MAADPTDTLGAFDRWLWGLDDDALACLDVRHLARKAAEDGVELPQLTFLTLIAADSPAIDVLHRRAAMTVTAARRAGDQGVLRSRLGAAEYTVGAFRAGKSGVYHLVGSVPVTDSRWRRVEETWVRSGAPKLAPVILNKADFEAISDALAEYGSVAVSRMTARVLHDQSSYTRGWKGEMARRPSPRQALSEAEGMLVRTLSVSVGTRLSIHLRRHAGATFYRGDYGLFCRVVLHRLTEAAAARRALLSDRDRDRVQPLHEALVMRLPKQTFLADSASRDLLASVGAVRGVQVAVFHRNPYLHFTVTDYLDGSNFDIFVTEDDQLTLLPGFRTSMGSLARVTDAIGDALGLVELRSESLNDAIPDAEFTGIA